MITSIKNRFRQAAALTKLCCITALIFEALMIYCIIEQAPDNFDSEARLIQANDQIAWIQKRIKEFPEYSPWLEENWKDLERKIPLNHWENKRIFKARILNLLDKKPEDLVGKYDIEFWQDRMEISQKAWTRATFYNQYGYPLIENTAGILGVLIGILLLFKGISLAWLFTLDRIREVSQAVRS